MGKKTEGDFDEFCIKTVNACSKFVFKCQIQYQTKFHYLQLGE